MNYNRYSREWLNKLNPYLDAIQNRTWEDVVKHFRFDIEQHVKRENLVILSEGVWMEIDILFSNRTKIRKIRAISKNDVYYDGDYLDFYDCLGLGSLNHIFKIDDHSLDLRDISGNEQQDKLLAFIEQYSGITDESLPPVPKGILKI